MNLYKLSTGVGDYWVIASHPTEAEEKLTKVLNDSNYGHFKDRIVQSIHFIAKEVDKTFIIAQY